MSAERLHEAATVLRERGEPEDSSLGLALADWLDDIGTRHRADPEPVELMLHYYYDGDGEECADCTEGNGHECVVCWGCYPSYDDMPGHAVYPCAELRAAVPVADAILAAEQ